MSSYLAVFNWFDEAACNTHSEQTLCGLKKYIQHQTLQCVTEANASVDIHHVIFKLNSYKVCHVYCQQPPPIGTDIQKKKRKNNIYTTIPYIRSEKYTTCTEVVSHLLLRSIRIAIKEAGSAGPNPDDQE